MYNLFIHVAWDGVVPKFEKEKEWLKTSYTKLTIHLRARSTSFFGEGNTSCVNASGVSIRVVALTIVAFLRKRGVAFLKPGEHTRRVKGTPDISAAVLEHEV